LKAKGHDQSGVDRRRKERLHAGADVPGNPAPRAVAGQSGPGSGQRFDRR
jgi:hypothetical protein